MRDGFAKTLYRHLSFEERPGENPWLDLLRCAAIGFVLARHGHRGWIEANGIAPQWGDHVLQWSDNVLLNGWIGVDLFLVLSGYLIARILIRYDPASLPRRLPVYLWRRALRIAPAYYAVLLAIVCGAFPLYALPREDLGWRLAYHVLMLQDYLPADINVVFWSLGVEMKFYVLAPFVMILVGWMRSPQALLFLLGILVLASTAVRWGTCLGAGVPEDYGAFWPVFRQPLHAVGEPLILGVGVAVLETRRLLRPSPRVAGWMLGGAVVAVVALSASDELMGRITMFDIVAQPLLIALLFAAAVTAGAALAEVGLPGRLAARVGARLSYALYLTHYPLLPLSLALAGVLGGTAAAYWTVFLGLSLASALVVHYVCEKPFLMAREVLAPGPLRTRTRPVRR